MITEEAVIFNRRVDRNKKLGFSLEFKLNGEFIDVSAWIFRFILTNNIQVVVWDIANGDFTRPNDYTIEFTKTPEELSLMDSGNYTISLLATNTDMLNNEIMVGTWYFN